MDNTLIKSLHSSPQVHYYTLLFFCFCLPVWSTGAVLSIITLLANSIFSGALFRNRKRLLHPIACFSIGLYAVYLVGLAYTGDMADGLGDVETKLSILIFPLIFFTAPLLSQEQKQKVLFAFVLGCLLTILWAMGQLIYYTVYLQIDLTANFANLVDIHSSYFCLYLGVGIFYLVQQLAPERIIALRNSSKILYGSLILIFIFAIFNLYAKMGFFLLTFLFTLFYLRYKFERKAYITGMFRAFFVLCLVAGLAKIIPASNHTIYGKIDIPNLTVEKDAEPDVRLLIWKSSLETVQKKMLFGHGTGDVHVTLLKSYQENQFDLGITNNFNPHNQYLQTSIALGLLGLFFLGGSFLTSLYYGWKVQHYFYLFFILLFGMACLTESMLEMEKGVLFYSFFNSFFAIDLLDRKKNPES